jgi:NAD-dependent dihydropyrimidine dehydrogenase PreA subunit
LDEPLLVKLLKRGFPHRFVIAKLSRWPILGGVIDHMLFENDDMIYLPKDQVIQMNKSIENPGEMVVPSQIVENFIAKANYHWIMDWCICRSATKCKDYPTNLGCLFLGEATLNIDPRIGHRATKQEAFEHVKKCREAGLVHLIGRNKLDAVWLRVEPGNKLLTVCNCCPCCCLWRVLPNLAPDIGSKITRMPGVKVTVTDRCVGCGTCTQGICFVDAIRVVNNRAVKSDECRGCGRCVDVCPQKAIELSIDNDKFMQEAVERISSSVDVS